MFLVFFMCGNVVSLNMRRFNDLYSTLAKLVFLNEKIYRKNTLFKQKNLKLSLEILNILNVKTIYIAPHSFKDALFILT